MGVINKHRNFSCRAHLFQAAGNKAKFLNRGFNNPHIDTGPQGPGNTS